MPRKTDYVPWQSKNCLALVDCDDNELQGEIDWKDEARPKTLDEIPAWDAARTEAHGNKTGQPPHLIAGRAHREEAILVQLKGTGRSEKGCANKCAEGDGIFESCRTSGLHRGACGNCIWQSKAMECTHVIEILEQEAKRKARLAEVKDLLLKTKQKPNTSKRTAKTKSAPARAAIEVEDDEDEDDEPQRPATLSKKAAEKELEKILKKQAANKKRAATNAAKKAAAERSTAARKAGRGE